jgi:hypothetical protein
MPTLKTFTKYRYAHLENIHEIQEMSSQVKYRSKTKINFFIFVSSHPPPPWKHILVNIIVDPPPFFGWGQVEAEENPLYGIPPSVRPWERWRRGWWSRK